MGTMSAYTTPVLTFILPILLVLVPLFAICANADAVKRHFDERSSRNLKNEI